MEKMMVLVGAALLMFYLQDSNGQMEAADLNLGHPVDCAPSHFGVNCERECHCAEEPCDKSVSPVKCLYGCQSGWMGEACDTRKQYPSVSYYCIKEGEDKKYAHIQVDTHGQEYELIYIDGSEFAFPACHLKRKPEKSTKFIVNAFVSNVQEVGIQEHDGFRWFLQSETDSETQTQQPSCPNERVNDTAFAWKLVVKENGHLSLGHDLEVEIICDFSTADSIRKSANFYPERNDDQGPQLAREHTNIDFQVVSPYSKAIISEAPLETPAVLMVSYIDSNLTGVMPKNCKVSSTFGNYGMDLLDGNGCPERGSPLSAFKMTKDRVAETDWFPLFSLGQADTIVFTCTFDPCFEGDNCDVGCFKNPNTWSRRKRETAEQDNIKSQGEGHSLTRTIRVLPKVSSKKDDKPDFIGNRLPFSELAKEKDLRND